MDIIKNARGDDVINRGGNHL